MSEVDKLIKESYIVMKKCQRGTNDYDKANTLHAECYGTIGALCNKLAELTKATKEGSGS